MRHVPTLHKTVFRFPLRYRSIPQRNPRPVKSEEATNWRCIVVRRISKPKRKRRTDRLRSSRGNPAQSPNLLRVFMGHITRTQKPRGRRELPRCGPDVDLTLRDYLVGKKTVPDTSMSRRKEKACLCTEFILPASSECHERRSHGLGNESNE